MTQNLTIPSLEEISVGCDPEFFVKKNGVYVPAEVTGVSGTKENPQSFGENKGAVQVDGCALEFNIFPALTEDEFSNNIEMTLQEVRKVVSDDIEFSFVPAVEFSSTIWDQTSVSSKRLGCEPDYDAYTMEAKTPPEGSGDKPFRTAAGHVHIGFTKDADPGDPRHIFDCSMISQALDTYVGFYEYCWAPENPRKNLYGSYGSFRPKSYGLEYRVLGNDWVNKPNLRKLIFLMSRLVVSQMLRGGIAYPIYLGRPDVTYDSRALYHLVYQWVEFSKRVYSSRIEENPVKKALCDAFENHELILPTDRYYLNDLRSYLTSYLGVTK